MPDKVWKAAERAIAKFWPGSRRRGPDTTSIDGDNGKSDLICKGWAVEIKHLKTVYFSSIVGAVEQSEANALPGELPVAVIHKKGMRYEDSLVVMRLKTYSKWHIGECSDGNKGVE